MNQIVSFFSTNKIYYLCIFFLALFIIGKGKILTEKLTTIILIFIFISLIINLYLTLLKKL